MSSPVRLLSRQSRSQCRALCDDFASLTRPLPLVRTSGLRLRFAAFSCYVCLTSPPMPPARAHDCTWIHCQLANRRTATRMTAVAAPPTRNNLVRWLNGSSRAGELGIVNEVMNDGRAVRVRLDSGEEHTFVWPNDRLDRVMFAPGQQVRSLSDREDGVVAIARERLGNLWYLVSMPGGVQKTVMESGLRPATISDPVELLRQGTLHEARSTNLRVVATRLQYANRYDELSSLSNSRVEIKPHQVAVVHRVSTASPPRFLLAHESGLAKTIE